MIKEQLQRSRQLGQLAPANTTAAAIYSPSKGVIGEVSLLLICNTSSSPVAYRIFHDKDGNTYAVGNALFYDVSLAANSTDIISLDFFGLAVLGDDDGTLGVRTDTADDVTFTVYGWEITK